MKFRRDTKSATADTIVPVTDIDLKALAGVQDEKDSVMLGPYKVSFQYAWLCCYI